jgi:hypothetical protein
MFFINQELKFKYPSNKTPQGWQFWLVYSPSLKSPSLYQLISQDSLPQAVTLLKFPTHSLYEH